MDPLTLAMLASAAPGFIDGILGLFGGGSAGNEKEMSERARRRADELMRWQAEDRARRHNLENRALDISQANWSANMPLRDAFRSGLGEFGNQPFIGLNPYVDISPFGVTPESALYAFAGGDPERPGGGGSRGGRGGAQPRGDGHSGRGGGKGKGDDGVDFPDDGGRGGGNPRNPKDPGQPQ